MTMMHARIRLIAAFLSMGTSGSIQLMNEEADVLMRDYAGVLVKMPLPHPGGLEFNIEDSSIHRLLQPFHSPVDESDQLFVTGPRRQSSRRLQDTCEAGDAFTLSSTVYGDAEGCYTASEEDSDVYGVVGTNRVLFTVIFESSGEVYWVSAALFASTDGSVYADIECLAEYVAGSHPADADSWECIFGSFLIGVSGDSFNLTCGCEELNDTPGGFGCGSTDNFTITSELLPTLVGCYLYTGNMNSTAFSQTGELIMGGVAVYTGYMNSEETDRRWFVGTYGTNSTSEDLTATCISLEDPDEASPADASWYCDFADIGIYIQVNESQFRVDCNCSGTWAPSPVPTTQVSIPIQSGNGSTPPTPAPTKESFCSATDSFSITSEQLQDLEGCYSDTGNLLSRSFTQTGELTVSQVAVYMGYVDFEDEDQRWFVGIFDPNATSENSTAKCISSEDPNEAHPADASWVCDFTGTGAYTATDEDNFRADCDCNDTSTPSPLTRYLNDFERATSYSPIVPTDLPTMPIDPAASNRGLERVPAMALSSTLACITSLILAAL